MFLGHFGAGFAGKAAAPRVSLGTLFLAAQLAPRALALAVGLVVASWMPAPAAACSCMTIPGSDGPTLAGYRAVVLATVVRVEEVWLPLPDRPDHFTTMNRVDLRVERVWKGSRRPELRLYTGNGGGDCGFLFAPGESYFVYTDVLPREQKRRLGETGTVHFTDICMPTVEAERAPRLRRQLDRLFGGGAPKPARPARP